MLRAVGLAVTLAGCDVISEALPSSQVDCGGTEAVLCAEVARLAVSRMNRDATGAVSGVALTKFADCERVGRANFLSDKLRFATSCWEVAVTGERSRGGGFVWRNPDGTLEASW
jgi:hypothetical protein